MLPHLPIISAWDPRATWSGSLDPLGALRACTAIAMSLLPGATLCGHLQRRGGTLRHRRGIQPGQQVEDVFDADAKRR